MATKRSTICFDGPEASPGRKRNLSVLDLNLLDGRPQKDRHASISSQPSTLSLGSSEASGRWMTEEVIASPSRQFRAHLKHVLCKRSFFTALLLASAAACVAVAFDPSQVLEGLPDDRLYMVFSTLVSFFVVIRTGHALSRLFEGATIVYSILGDWSDAVSSLLSFTRTANAEASCVASFQNMLVILVSMLNALCLAELEDTTDSKANNYSLVNYVGFPSDVLSEISSSERRVETVFQMIQALIVDNMDSGILNVPAPILTRSFQEMSQAMLKVHEAHKLVNVPYPVDMNAAGTFLLLIHSIVTVYYVPLWLPEAPLAIGTIFVLVFSYWFVHLISGELDQPFSSACTAIDLALVQDELNQRLQTFLLGARRAPLELRPEMVGKHEPDAAKSINGLQSYVFERQSRERSRGRSSEGARAAALVTTVESDPPSENDHLEHLATAIGSKLAHCRELGGFGQYRGGVNAASSQQDAVRDSALTHRSYKGSTQPALKSCIASRPSAPHVGVPKKMPRNPDDVSQPKRVDIQAEAAEPSLSSTRDEGWLEAV